MSHPSRVFFLACSLLVATSLSAASQDAVSLVGTWKGTGYAVHIGPSPYRPAQGASVNFPDQGIEFFYAIKRQEGNRFAGEMSAGNNKERLIGALQPNNRGGIMLDDDGEYNFVLIDKNAMDLCYSHNSEAGKKLVACLRVTRSNGRFRPR